MALLLGNALASSPCMVYTSDARLQLAERQYLYPDLVVACGEQSGTMLINPTVVIEVLSPTTEKRDRGAKFNDYAVWSPLALDMGRKHRLLDKGFCCVHAQ